MDEGEIKNKIGRGQLVTKLYQYLVYFERQLEINRNLLVNYEEIKNKFNLCLVENEKLDSFELIILLQGKDVLLTFLFMLGINIKIDTLNNEELQNILDKDWISLPKVSSYNSWRSRGGVTPVFKQVGDVYVDYVFNSGISTRIQSDMMDNIFKSLKSLTKQKIDLLPSPFSQENFKTNINNFGEGSKFNKIIQSRVEKKDIETKKGSKEQIDLSNTEYDTQEINLEPGETLQSYNKNSSLSRDTNIPEITISNYQTYKNHFF